MDKISRKSISLPTLIETLQEICIRETKEELIFSANIYEGQDARMVSYKKYSSHETWVYDFPEMEIRTFYNQKYFKVKHPSSFIKIKVRNGRIDEMLIYPYKKNEGLETKLLDNPFPNGYDSNSTCMGSADRKTAGDNIKAIIGILETPYTHATTGFIGNELKATEAAFQYLQDNQFPYDRIKATNKKLSEIL